VSNERWLTHIKRLAKDNANLRVEVRNLRLQVTSLKDEVEHCQKEYARQNARIITMEIQRQVDGDEP